MDGSDLPRLRSRIGPHGAGGKRARCLGPGWMELQGARGDRRRIDAGAGAPSGAVIA